MKIGDFGLSLFHGVGPSSAGTLCYVAPEIFAPGAKASKRSDIYGLAMIMWITRSRCNPYPDVKDNGEVQRLVLNGEHNDIYPDTPPVMKDLIQRCWDGRPEKRPELDVIIAALKTEAK